MEPDRSVRARGLAATAALVVGYLSVSGLLAWGTAGAVGAVREPGPTSVDAALALTAAAGGWLVLSWLTALTVLTCSPPPSPGWAPGRTAGRRRSHRGPAAGWPVPCSGSPSRARRSPPGCRSPQPCRPRSPSPPPAPASTASTGPAALPGTEGLDRPGRRRTGRVDAGPPRRAAPAGRPQPFPRPARREHTADRPRRARGGGGPPRRQPLGHRRPAPGRGRLGRRDRRRHGRGGTPRTPR